jgi:hypothetical protein
LGAGLENRPREFETRTVFTTVLSNKKHRLGGEGKRRWWIDGRSNPSNASRMNSVGVGVVVVVVVVVVAVVTMEGEVFL